MYTLDFFLKKCAKNGIKRLKMGRNSALKTRGELEGLRKCYKNQLNWTTLKKVTKDAQKGPNYACSCY